MRYNGLGNSFPSIDNERSKLAPSNPTKETAKAAATKAQSSNRAKPKVTRSITFAIRKALVSSCFAA